MQLLHAAGFIVAKPAHVNRQRHQDAGAGCGNGERPPIDQVRAVRRSGRILPGVAPWHNLGPHGIAINCSLKVPSSGAMRNAKNPAANTAHSPRSPHGWRCAADNRRPDDPVNCGSAVRWMERRRCIGQNVLRHRSSQVIGIRPSIIRSKGQPSPHFAAPGSPAV